MWYVLSLENFVKNCFIDINNIENLPNVFLRGISKINDQSKIAIHF